ncbi:MAG: TIGR03936 family radical SAM-associated protein, partial [Anaerovoracaceae bacterium]
MARYSLKFAKEGYIKYTSHLDMLRLFKRAFKKAGVHLEHSQGFNPHPKMSFAQPLSLGYTSIGELIEFETREVFEEETIAENLRAQMPEGIRIIECKALSPKEKSLAAACTAAEYIIAIPLPEGADIPRELGTGFLAQEQIVVKKKKKKSREFKDVEIKAMIHSLSIDVLDGNLFMSTTLAAGSNENLSPELLIQAFS